MLVMLVLAAAAANTVPPICPAATNIPVAGKPKAGIHKLGDEPPARQLYAVLRTENGCTKPLPVNARRIGNRRR